MEIKIKLSFYIKMFLISLIFLLRETKSKSIIDYSHEENSLLHIQAGSLSSIKGIIPFSYDKLRICNTKKVSKAEDTLGEILTGEKLFNTPYIALMKQDSLCETLCLNQFDIGTIKKIKTLIKRKYFVNWYLDKLPAGKMSFNFKTFKTTIDYFNGIPLGYINNDTYYIYNHLQFHILINEVKEGGGNLIKVLKGEETEKKNTVSKYNVVGFNIIPMSMKHNGSEALCKKEEGEMIGDFEIESQRLDESEILFTYDIIFEHSDITIASRWDHYKPTNKKIHWLGIIVSELIVMIITFILGGLLVRAVRNQIDGYNINISKVDFIDEFGWREIAGDVFRPPRINSKLLSAIIGTGVQLFFMLAVTLFLGTVGFLNPEKRIHMLNLGIIMFCIMGLPGGYFSARFHRLFGGQSWLLNAILTAILYPGAVVLGYIFVNFLLVLEKSSAAVNIFDIFSLFILWTFCTFPLILMGSFLGIKSKKIQVPYKVNPIPTMIPNKPFYMHYKFITFITGVIGFGTIFIELSYVMAALWRHQIYFLATFLWINLFLLIIVSAELSIIVVYLNLCYGDYNWWWKSFLIGGSPVIYFVLYSIIYFFWLKITRFSAMVVYFGIMSLISSMALFVCGSFSTVMTFLFVKFIYSRVKLD